MLRVLSGQPTPCQALVMITKTTEFISANDWNHFHFQNFSSKNLSDSSSSPPTSSSPAPNFLKIDFGPSCYVYKFTTVKHSVIYVYSFVLQHSKSQCRWSRDKLLNKQWKTHWRLQAGLCGVGKRTKDWIVVCSWSPDTHVSSDHNVHTKQ